MILVNQLQTLQSPKRKAKKRNSILNLPEARITVDKLKPRRAVGHSQKNDLLQCLLDISKSTPVTNSDMALACVED